MRHQQVTSFPIFGHLLSPNRTRCVQIANRRLLATATGTANPKTDARRLTRLEHYARRLKAWELGQPASGMLHLPCVKPYLPEQVPVKDDPAPHPKPKRLEAWDHRPPGPATKRLLIGKPFPSEQVPVKDDPAPHAKRDSRQSGVVVLKRLLVGKPSLPEQLPVQNDPSSHPGAQSVIYRAVDITNLHPSCTLTDVMQSIAAAGPFGMVTSAYIGQHMRHSVTVVFNTEQAALRFIAHHKTTGFRINYNPSLGVRRAPLLQVEHNRSVRFFEESNSPTWSRVLRIVGDPTCSEFDEASLRRILKEKLKPGPFLEHRFLESEPPRTSWLENGEKAIDWAFFSNENQTRPFQVALMGHFQGRLFVGFGIDPCEGLQSTGSADRKVGFHYGRDES